MRPPDKPLVGPGGAELVSAGEEKPLVSDSSIRFVIAANPYCDVPLQIGVRPIPMADTCCLF